MHQILSLSQFNHEITNPRKNYLALSVSVNFFDLHVCRELAHENTEPLEPKYIHLLA